MIVEREGQGREASEGSRHVRPGVRRRIWRKARGNPPEVRGALQLDLPEAGPAADLSSIRPPRVWVALCFALPLLVSLGLIPHFLDYSNPPTGDQPFYMMVTASLVQDHDLNLANNYAQRDEDKFYPQKQGPRPPGFVGMAAPYPLPPHLASTPARPKTEWYDYHLPGLPLLLVPAWIVGGWFGLWWPAAVVVMCLVGALLGLNVFLLAYQLTGRTWIGLAVWLPIVFSNPLMSYSFLIFTELPVGLLLLYAVRRLAMGWHSNGMGRLLVVGLCIAYIPWLAWRCLPISATLLLYAGVQWSRYRYRRTPSLVTGQPAHSSSSTEPSPERRLPDGTAALRAAAVLLPVAISAVLLGWYNLFLFGALLPPEQVPETALPPFHWPWQGSQQFTDTVTNCFALLFDRQMGLLTYAPFYLLAVAGVFAVVRAGRASDRRLLFWIALVSLPYFFVLMSFIYWNGLWCPPARFLTTLIPLLAAPLAISLYVCSGLLYRALYALLALPGLVLAAIMMHDPRLLWPGNPLFGWLASSEQSPIHLDIRRVLPIFSPVDALRLPGNLGWEMALSVLIVRLGYLAVLRSPARYSRRTLSPAVHTALWVAAMAVLAGGWLVTSFDYISPHTVLIQQHRWSINRPLSQPLGIAYLDGRVYVADYKGAMVGALDTSTGEFSLVKPALAETPLVYAHPGDVKVGPNGLLYVLNNGQGNEAVYAMRPDGQVVDRIGLEDKSQVAVGLQFNRAGELYISDMVGGRVRRYPPGGGKELSEWTGEGSGFNNVAGIALAADGTVYAAEMSGARVEQISSEGQYVRSFPLRCRPWYLALNGNWLDATCDRGLVSVNIQSGEVRDARLGEPDPPLSSPTGITYGPDGTLYLVDGNDLAAYKVTH